MASSFHDLNRPVLTFVGRPGDWNKGLETFLDALELLVTTAGIPVFDVWLVGGSKRELRTVNGWAERRANVQWLQQRGRLVLWGRVAPDALPELMSRSSVLVVPSNREQFGIVAIEAMMCACPVLGSRVGGLRDIVVDGRVGHLVSRGDCAGFAFALTGLLRLPAYWRSLGRNAGDWAAENFKQDQVFGRLRRLYTGMPVTQPHRVVTPQPFFMPKLDRTSWSIAERALGAPLRRAELMAESHGGATYALEGATRKGVAKVIGTIPNLRDGVFRSTRGRRKRDEFETYRTKLAFVAGSGLGPAVITSDAKRSIFILEWIDGTTGSMDPTVLMRLRRWRPPPAERCEELSLAVESMRRKRTAEALGAVDRIAFLLNAQCAGGDLPVHPAVELERLRQHLADRAFPLAPDRHKRLARAVDDHVVALGDGDCSPALCHGDFQPGHVLATNGGARLIGLRMLRYAAGPLDEARWILHAASGSGGRLDAAAVLTALSRHVPDMRMMVGWIAAEALTEALCAALRGDTAMLDAIDVFLERLLTLQGSVRVRERPVESRSSG